jgi:hypothetical protein
MWRSVVGYEGVYSVSDLGRVRREIDRYGKKSGRVLKNNVHPDTGYHRVILFRRGVRDEQFTHALVARAFLGPCPEGSEVNHKNTKRADPRLENLEYLTHLENVRHSVEFGNHVSGSDHAHAKLTEADVQLIRSLRPGVTEANLGVMFKVSRGTIHDAVSGKTWHHVSGVCARREVKTCAKLTREAVIKIRELAADGTTCPQIGRRFEVNSKTILAILQHRTWRWVP